MKLEEVLALHPKGADAATLSAAIERAEALRSDLLTRAAELDRTRAAGLLTLEARTILKAEEEAAQARLAAERIEALLPAIRTDLHTAEGAEALAELRAEALAVGRTVAELQAWLDTELPKIPPLLREGFDRQAEAVAAHGALLTSIEAAYARQAVRDAGPLGVDLPRLPSRMPRSLFPGWS